MSTRDVVVIWGVAIYVEVLVLGLVLYLQNIHIMHLLHDEDETDEPH